MGTPTRSAQTTNWSTAAARSDVGVETTIRIIQRIEERVQRDKYMGIEELNRVLKEEIAALLKENNANDQTTFELPDNGLPYVIMVVGQFFKYTFFGFFKPFFKIFFFPFAK